MGQLAIEEGKVEVSRSYCYRYKCESPLDPAISKSFCPQHYLEVVTRVKDRKLRQSLRYKRKLRSYTRLRNKNKMPGLTGKSAFLAKVAGLKMHHYGNQPLKLYVEGSAGCGKTTLVGTMAEYERLKVGTHYQCFADVCASIPAARLLKKKSSSRLLAATYQAYLVEMEERAMEEAILMELDILAIDRSRLGSLVYDAILSPDGSLIPEEEWPDVQEEFEAALDILHTQMRKSVGIMLVDSNTEANVHRLIARQEEQKHRQLPSSVKEVERDPRYSEYSTLLFKMMADKYGFATIDLANYPTNYQVKGVEQGMWDWVAHQVATLLEVI